MARKKSISGRSRRPTIASRLIRAIDKSNKALNRLERNQSYGTYASRRLLKLSKSSAFNYKRKRKFKFKIRDIKSLNIQEQLFYLKKFEKFLKSPTSKVSGIKIAKGEVRKRVKQSLGEIAEKQLTDQDVEDFFDMMYDNQFTSITDYISPSDEFAIISEAKEQNYSEDKFVNILVQTSNIENPSEDFRNKAIKLYNKYVK